MKIATTTSLSIVSLLAVVKSVSGYANCRQADTGDVFEANYTGLKGGNAFDCRLLDNACLSDIVDNPAIAISDGNTAPDGLEKLIRRCNGSSPERTLNPANVNDVVMLKKLFTKVCDAIKDSEPVKRKACVEGVVVTALAQGNNGENCKIMTSIKAAFDANSLTLKGLTGACVNKMTDPFSGIAKEDIATHLKYLKAEVWEHLNPDKNEPLKDIWDTTPGLINAALVDGKKILDLVPSLNNLHIEIIKKIGKASEIFAMKDPFAGLNGTRLVEVKASIWTEIAALNVASNKAKIDKLAKIEPTALKDALNTATFVTSFVSTLPVMPASLLKKLDHVAVEKVKDSLTAAFYPKFNGASVAQAAIATNATARTDLKNILAKANPSTEEAQFVRELCGHFNDFPAIRSHFTFILPTEPLSKTCFNKLKKPLNSVTAGQLAEIIDVANKALKPDAKYFPAGFTKSDLTKKAFASLGDASLYNYAAGGPNATAMEVFCEWGYKHYVVANNIGSVAVSNDCRGKMKDANAFNNTNSIAENIKTGGVIPGDITADQLTGKTIAQFFAGIKAKDLVLLREEVIKKLTKKEDFESITEPVFSKALKIATTNNLVAHVDYSKIPANFYKAFTYDVLSVAGVKSKLEKEQWALTDPKHHESGGNWIAEAKLKAALEAGGNFLEKYCSERTSITDLTTTFTGLKIKAACLAKLTSPLSGFAAVADFAELDASQKLKLKATVFDTDVTPEKITKEVFRSIKSTILITNDPAFLKICELGRPDWLDGNLAVHQDCRKLMKAPIDKLKDEVNSAADNTAKRAKFDAAEKSARIEFISDKTKCAIFEALTQFGEVLDQVSADCYGLMTGSKKLAGLKTFASVKKELFELFKAEDVEDDSQELWATASKPQLELLKEFSTVPSDDDYKTHPCSKLNTEEFLKKISSADKKREIKDACFKRTKVQGNSSEALRAVLGLTIFASMLALTF